MDWRPGEVNISEARLAVLRKRAGLTDTLDLKVAAHLLQQMIKTVVNDIYEVMIFDAGEFTHLAITRHDNKPITSWEELQRIKNELVGPEHEAIELYPAESRLTNLSHQRHLWVLKTEQRLSLGWDFGREVTNG